LPDDSRELEEAEKAQGAAGRPDGRVQRGARNRASIAEAMLELVREGDPSPTAEQVAKRAGVAMRTVFRHFDDMESLHAELAELVEREVRPVEQGGPPLRGSVEERLAEIVRRRSVAFERFAPFVRASMLHRRTSPFVRQRYAAMVKRLRQELIEGVPELADAAPEVLEAIDLLGSFESWDRLRSEQRLGRDRARSVLEAAVLAVMRRAD